jgi:hypothetical protein
VEKPDFAGCFPKSLLRCADTPSVRQAELRLMTEQKSTGVAGNPVNFC